MARLILLGAGAPARGDVPSALKKVAPEVTTIDWQLGAFEDEKSISSVQFVGGYHINEIIEKYPKFDFLSVPDWQNGSIVDSLLRAPFLHDDTYIAYTDILYRKETIERLSVSKADIAICVDSRWRIRYENRSEDDLKRAETFCVDGVENEFIGLAKFGTKVTQFIGSSALPTEQANLIELIGFLESKNHTIEFIDVDGDWAELNAPQDIAQFILGTKADTLARLKPMLTKSEIGDQISITYSQWQERKEEYIKEVQARFQDCKLVVRSSSRAEDSWRASNAGKFHSVLNVDANSGQDLGIAIDSVFQSYLSVGTDAQDQVLIQEHIFNSTISGVVFTCNLETGAPYYRLNIDDQSSSTDSVTSGLGEDLRTFLIAKQKIEAFKSEFPELRCIMDAIREIESLLIYEKLDIEFAVDAHSKVHIFQVRPIVVDHSRFETSTDLVLDSLNGAAQYFEALQVPKSNIVGNRAIFSNMSDWNPVEMIGQRPSSLAYSFYKFLISDDIWAEQRFEYGYKDLRRQPLIVSFAGQPYVDVRSSLNSFIPSSVSEETTEAIVNCYLKILASNPNFHDKLEFEVAFTCWVPYFKDLAEARLRLLGIEDSQISELEDGLKTVTRAAVSRLETDIASLKKLKPETAKIIFSEHSSAVKIVALLEICKSHGTLAFAHVARAGFVASSFLRRLVELGVFSVTRLDEFMASVQTVSGEYDLAQNAVFSDPSGKSLEQFIDKFGHLRPGTYDICSKAYWESYEQYFSQPMETTEIDASEGFALTPEETVAIETCLAKLEAGLSANEIIEFCRSAIEAREDVKFQFTRNISLALDYCVTLGKELGISREDMAHTTLVDIQSLQKLEIDKKEFLRRIQTNKDKQLISEQVELPAVLLKGNDFFFFERLRSQPNFVTNLSLNAEVVKVAGGLSDAPKNLVGKLVLIERADPGYDWLFSHNIAGLITKYGGANSHMAVRSAEKKIPAAIGVGEQNFERLLDANFVFLDCRNQQIKVTR